MSLAAVTSELEAHWQRTVRRHDPAARWSAQDPLVPADSVELRRRLDDRFSNVGRDLLARIVRLAGGGDRDAALAATLTIVRGMVTWEKRGAERGLRNSTHHVQHDALAGAAWEAVVTEQRPDRPHLYEALVQKAWRVVRRPVRASTNEPATLAAYTQDHTDPRADREISRESPSYSRRVRRASTTVEQWTESVALSAATVDELLGQLVTHGCLNAKARTILANIAAGGDGLRHQPGRCDRAAATERRRLLNRLRSVTGIRDALAG